jgi:hypothetical protein
MSDSVSLETLIEDQRKVVSLIQKDLIESKRQITLTNSSLIKAMAESLLINIQALEILRELANPVDADGGDFE